MATKVTVVPEDDLYGESVDESVLFGIFGTDCNFGLSIKSVSAFRWQLSPSPYIEHTLKTGRRQDCRLVLTSASREHDADVRTWEHLKALHHMSREAT